MKTLIIHPKDVSTTFLKPIYWPVPNKTVITGGITKKELAELILRNDRIIMLGHGLPWGLLAVGQFPDAGMYIVDASTAPLLKGKSNNIYIWCNSDGYVKQHELEGFYSGMFISEVSEARMMGLPGIDQSQIDQSNWGFSYIVARYINECAQTGAEELCANVKLHYGLMTLVNPVADYNNERLYFNIND